MSKTGTDISYTYNADGLRSTKTVGSTVYQYYYDPSGQLTDVLWGSNKLHFVYDSLGPVAVTYNGTRYYYLRNAQGDITGIMTRNKEQVVSYTYDAWGNVLSVTGTMADTLGAANPLRYRGYIYDSETNLYYLQSRYYNPSWGRFINADGYVSTGQGFVGNNMFAYCNNNPVNRMDEQGTLFNVVVGGVVGAVFGGISAAIKGESILFGALIGGMTGAATAAVGVLIVAKTAAAIATKVAASAVIGAAGNALTQYTNYRLQDQAKRENKRKGITTTVGSTRNGQSQAVANEAYNADSFKEYVDTKSIAVSAATSAFAEGLNSAYSCIAPTQSLSALPKAVWPKELARDVMVSFEISMIQCAFDIGLS